MSGGYFEYKQYQINDIADQSRRAIENNEKVDEYGSKQGFSKETLQRFEKAVLELDRVRKMVHEIDWLLSGDTGEESFHKRWREEGLET